MQSYGQIISACKIGSIILGFANKNEQYAALLVVGIIYPPPRYTGSSEKLPCKNLKFTFLIGSSHKGPSLEAHWNPYIIEFLTINSFYLSVSKSRE